MNPAVTYQKFYDENETSTEGRNGRFYTGVVGWVYEVRVDGEYAGDFKRLRDVKRAYPQAVRRPRED
jgi:hypothetical protein